MSMMRTFGGLVSPLLPTSLKRSVRQVFTEGIPQDNHFRPCSPASPPELAQCLLELNQSRLLEGGSYYEFGLFRGYALWFVQDLIRRLGIRDFHCHGFDSFAGLPKPSGVDESAPWSEGDFAVSRSQVERNLREFNADFSKISLHEGFFSDRFFKELKAKAKFGRAALVLVDCDLYASTVPVLKFIRPLLTSGTMVLFDDYDCFKASDERGQRRALREFLAGAPDMRAEPLRTYPGYGKTFRIEMQSDSAGVRRRSIAAAHSAYGSLIM